jgi:hydroxyquinol 1,2-dioxygenase
VSSRRTAPADITAAVIASFEGSEEERLCTLAQSLTRHLHAFATEVGLTQREWEEGVRILTETGEITDERRQEFILWSDTLGLSMLVDALANPFPPGATESTVLGPSTSPDRRNGPTGRRSPRKPQGRPRGSTAVCST